MWDIDLSCTVDCVVEIAGVMALKVNSIFAGAFTRTHLK
jgi:hypothetical protein